MRRVTVTVDDSVLETVQKDVAAGRAASVSAWVSDAMQKKAQALQELLADVEALNRERPPSEEALATVARSLGRSRAWVARRIGVRRKGR